MSYLLHFLIKTPDGALQRLIPDQHRDELPRLGYGDTTIVEEVSYRVGSIPHFKQTPEVLLTEVLLVSEEEYERQKATGMVPVASIEQGFNLDGEWTKVE